MSSWSSRVARGYSCAGFFPSVTPLIERLARLAQRRDGGRNAECRETWMPRGESMTLPR